MLILWLVVATWGRRVNLDGEPHSLAASLGLLSRSPALTRDLDNSEYHDPDALLKMLRESICWYRLALVPDQGPMVEIIGDQGGTESEGNRLLPPTPAPTRAMEPFTEKPTWSMSRWTRVVFFLFFFVLLVALVVVFIYLRDNGMSLDLLGWNGSNIIVGYKFLPSYLPTIFGTAVEPLIVTLGPYYCMIGPYKVLRRGRPPATSPLALVMDYDKSPPHFQLLRSIKIRDIELGALTVGILLANVLAVSFAALLSVADDVRDAATEI